MRFVAPSAADDRARTNGAREAADDEGVREEGAQLDGPDAGAHVQDGAHALGSEWREIMITQRPIQRMVLVVEPLILEGIFGQEIGHVGQGTALGSWARSASSPKTCQGNGVGEAGAKRARWRPNNVRKRAI